MYEVSVEGAFCATHQLPLPDNTAERRHGHDWRVRVVWRGRRLDRRGFLVDFTAAEQALNSLMTELDHTHLNDHPRLEGTLPSAENVARIIFEVLDSAPCSADASLASVRVSEAPGCIATYARE